MKSPLRIIWFSLLCASALWGFFFLILTLIYDAKGAVEGDVMIFLSIGRGMQNGLSIYTDMFESKPPGVLLLSYLSMWLTNGPGLMRIAQDIGLLVVPFFLAYISRQRLERAVCAFTFGCTLSCWSYANSMGMETEIFGLLPMVLYAVLITSPMNQKKVLLSGVCTFLATFFREPFILGGVAASILVSKNPKEFVLRFVYPAIVAGVIYLLALTFTGVLIPYFQVYLPGMLKDRIQTADSGPLYLRAIWVQRIFSSLTTYSSVPLLGYFVTALGLFVTISKEKMDRIGILSMLAMLFGAWGLGEYFVLLTVCYKQGGHGFSCWTTVTDPGLWMIDSLFVCGTVLFLGLLAYIGKKNLRMLVSILCALSVLPILGAAISLGGYGRRYLLFLIPVIVSLFLISLKKLNTIVLASLVAILTITSRAPNESLQIIKAFHENQKLSAQLDGLMEACGYKTYVFGGHTPVFAFSKYSPIGPLFVFPAHTYLGYDHPLYQETMLNMLRMGKLLVVEIPYNDSYFPPELRNLFAATEPACAKGHMIPGFVLRFRD
jgi:hypothetical protein